MKFYELQQLGGGARWYRIAFLKTKKEAEKYESLFNTKTEVYPTRIVEREFVDIDKEDFS